MSWPLLTLTFTLSLNLSLSLSTLIAFLLLRQGQIIIFLAGILDFLGPMWLKERVIKIISFCDISLKTIFYQTFVLMLAKLLLLKQSVGGKGIFKMNQYSRREATCDFCGKVQVGWTSLEWLAGWACGQAKCGWQNQMWLVSRYHRYHDYPTLMGSMVALPPSYNSHANLIQILGNLAAEVHIQVL